MQSTTSVSQGSFVFLPENFNLSKLRKSQKRKLCDENVENWENAFNSLWDVVNKEVADVNELVFKKVLAGLIKHINSLHSEIQVEEGILPCEILLTGTNLPDHNLLIFALTDSLLKEVTPFISTLWSRNCGNIRSAVTSLVQQILNVATQDESINKDDIEDEDSESENEAENLKLKFQVSQYNMSTLSAWYSRNKKDNLKVQPVIIFFPDFESVLSNVLSELILLLSSYSSQVPFVLVFGVATTPCAVYQSLPRNVLSQLVIQIFKSEPSISFLNQVIEKIFFSEKCPFRLGSKCMTFLTDIFLFHSFSVQSFIQGFKFCMMEHFYKKNHFALCCSTDDLHKRIEQLQDDDLESIRRISSFQRFVEKSCKEKRVSLLCNNQETKIAVREMMKEVQDYLRNFHVALKCLHILTQDLPQYPLGRHLREYYCKAVSKDIRECSEFKECMSALKFQSRIELTTKIALVIELLKINSLVDILSLDKSTKFDEISAQLEIFKSKLDEIATQNNIEDEDNGTSKLSETRKELLQYIKMEIIDKMLLPVVNLPLHEIVLFDDFPTIRRRISGSPRGAIHLALNNPQYYLDCKCCVLPHAEAVLPTLPDLSVVYKLHLEFGKIINLYNWMQAFAACIKPEMSEAEAEADEVLQARFTRAVAELQFLGFIKPSRTKSDHVTRLTWGSI